MFYPKRWHIDDEFVFHKSFLDFLNPKYTSLATDIRRGATTEDGFVRKIGIHFLLFIDSIGELCFSLCMVDIEMQILGAKMSNYCAQCESTTLATVSRTVSFWTTSKDELMLSNCSAILVTVNSNHSNQVFNNNLCAKMARNSNFIITVAKTFLFCFTI